MTACDQNTRAEREAERGALRSRDGRQPSRRATRNTSDTVIAPSRAEKRLMRYASEPIGRYENAWVSRTYSG